MSRQKPVMISRGVLLDAECVCGGYIHASDMLMYFPPLYGLQGLCMENSLQKLDWNCMHVEKIILHT